MWNEKYMSTPAQKPVLFLDFDLTLFDLGRFMRDYLGMRHEEHSVKFREFLTSTPTTDISAFMYEDAVPFLKRARETHTLVLLSRARTFPEYQRKKILGSQVAEHLDDIIVTPSDDKGLFALPFLPNVSDGAPLPEGYMFIDDNLDALQSMNRAAPFVRTLRIDRFKKDGLISDDVSEIIHSLEDLLLM
jgi:hypothetical protein